MLNYFKAHGKVIARWVTIATAIGGIWVAYSQLHAANEQIHAANEQNRWQYYNDLNARYAVFYESIPNEVSSGRETDFDKLQPQAKRWVRQYFDLYSEEYWLYKNRLIPEEMWTKRILSGVRVNLLEYPLLVSGYRYWKERGAFKHPDGFFEEVERAIADTSNSPIKSRLPIN